MSTTLLAMMFSSSRNKNSDEIILELLITEGAFQKELVLKIAQNEEIVG